MTEHDAQQVLLVRAIERQPASSTWTDEDRLHASQEALRQTGPEAERSTFVIERARLACERLIARKPALGDLLHSLQWRGWFTPWRCWWPCWPAHCSTRLAATASTSSTRRCC